MKDEDFIGQIFPQNCGDNLRVISKSDKKQGSNYLYYCKFQKYPYEVLALKNNIIKGRIVNYKINDILGKIYVTKNGILKVIEKVDKVNDNYKYYYKCQFLDYPYETIARKSDIKVGQVPIPKYPLL